MRARKRCAAAVLGVALFAPSAPAHADDAPAASDGSVASIAADVDAASSAAAAQASAIVGEVSTAAPEPTVEPPPPIATTDASGSTSGLSGGISDATSPQPEQGPTPTIDGATASAVEGATQAATAVVAAAKQVVSLPQAPAAGTGSVPAPNTAPVEGTTDTGGQYQENGGRYQSDNPNPVSSEIGRISPTESSPEPAAGSGRTSTPKSGRIPLPKCLQDLPDSVLQTACDDALSQLPDVRTVLGAPPSKHPRARTHPHRAHQTKPASRAVTPSPAATTHWQTESAPHGPAIVVAVPTATHTVLADTRRERPVDVRAHRVQPVRVRRTPEPSLVIRPDTRVRDAAGSKRTTAATSTPLFVVALLLGLVSLALALGSLRVRRGAALTAIRTRVRSKGLSSATKVRPGPREEAPRAIRYRE